MFKSRALDFRLTKVVADNEISNNDSRMAYSLLQRKSLNILQLINREIPNNIYLSKKVNVKIFRDV